MDRNIVPYCRVQRSNSTRSVWLQMYMVVAEVACLKVVSCMRIGMRIKTMRITYVWTCESTLNVGYSSTQCEQALSCLPLLF